MFSPGISDGQRSNFKAVGNRVEHNLRAGMAADGNGFEPASADAWRENVPDDLQEIMARARGRLVEHIRHALTDLPQGKPRPRGESRWSSAGYRKLKTYGKNEDTTRAFCTWEHNADGFKDVPEAVSVLRLPCSVEHVREICCRWELRPSWDANCERASRGQEFNPLCGLFENVFKSRLMFSKRCTRGITAWDELKNGGWLMWTAAIPHEHSLVGALEHGTIATTLNVGGYYIEPGEGDNVGTCKVVVLLHVGLGGSLSKMNKLAYILSLGKNFTKAIFLWARWVKQEWTPATPTT